MSFDEFLKSFKLFAMFIGRSGSGKSAAAASMPKPFEELDFDVRANGIRNCIEQGWLSGVEGKDIIFKTFDPFGGYLQVQEYLNLKYVMAKGSSSSFTTKTIDVGSLFNMLRLLELTSLNSQKGGLNIAGLALTGPADYKFETQATTKIMDFLRILPCHVTVAAHVVDKYGKASGADPYSPSTIIGEKLTITANLGESILAMFNDVYKFSKEIINGEDRYFVEFNTEIGKNSFGIPPGKFDITRKEFWPYFVDLIKSLKEGTFKKPVAQVNSGVFTL